MEEKIKEQIAEEIAMQMMEGAAPAEVTIRKGEALKLQEPVRVKIDGTIDAPARWIEIRAEQLEQKAGFVLVDREGMRITYRDQENSVYGDEIIGRLTFAKEFLEMKINTGEYMTNFEMAELIKMHRSFFENKSVAMRIVSDLQNFKAKVDRDIENSNNNRGDRRLLIAQAVQHNLPEVFNMVIPVFKGQPRQTIACEVYVEPSNFNCSLQSPEAIDFINEQRDAIMNEVLRRISDACPDIAIIEI